MTVPTIDLLEDLQRLEDELGEFPSANDVVREGNHAMDTFYSRFSWNWREVEATYNDWKETGEIPEEYQPTDWASLNQNLRKNSGT